MVAVCAADDAGRLVDHLVAAGEQARPIGMLEASDDASQIRFSGALEIT